MADLAGAADSNAELFLPSSTPLSMLLVFAVRTVSGRFPGHICPSSQGGGLHHLGLMRNFLTLRGAVGWTNGSPLLGCSGLPCIALGILSDPQGWCMNPWHPFPRLWGGKLKLL